MNGPTQEEARAEIDYRRERMKRCFLEGRLTCEGMRLQVSGREVRRLRTEMERRQKERDAARRLFEKRKDLDSERRWIEAEVAFGNAKASYELARAAR